MSHGIEYNRTIYYKVKLMVNFVLLQLGELIFLRYIDFDFFARGQLLGARIGEAAGCRPANLAVGSSFLGI